MSDLVVNAEVGPAPKADALWDDWSTPPRVPDSPVLHLEGFEGPMDLLLDLAERQRISLGGMSIIDLATQFVAAMERLMGHVPLERLADWLVVAARLVHLKSRYLFPESPQVAAEAEREVGRELRRIDDMAVIRQAVGWLQRRPQLDQDVFARPITTPPREGGYVALMEACLAIFRVQELAGQGVDDDAYQIAIPNLWRVPDAIARIRTILHEQPEGGEFCMFLPPILPNASDRDLRARVAVASTFVGGLELAKEGCLLLEQDGTLAPLTLRATTIPIQLITA